LTNAGVRRWTLHHVGLPVPTEAPPPVVVPASAANAPAGAAVRDWQWTETVSLPPLGPARMEGVSFPLVAGDTFVASFTEERNRELRVYATGPDGARFWDAGVVRGPYTSAVVTVPASGNYTVWFENDTWKLERKTVAIRVEYPRR